MMKKISVVLPTYNEKGNILRLVEEIHRQLGNVDHEIIVADDNSPDGTYQALVDLNKPYIVPILRTRDRGFANSIRCGLERAQGDVLVVMDSDFNHKPEYLPFMLEAIRYYDCVAASRFVYGGSMEGPIHHMLSWIFNIFIRIMTGGSVTDSLYGFFAIRREVLFRCDLDRIFWGYGDYCIRLFYYLQNNKATFLQFPAVNGRRLEGDANKRFLQVFWKYFSEVIRFSIRININREWRHGNKGKHV